MATSLVPSHSRWSYPAGATSLTQFQFCAINASAQIITPPTTGVYAVVLDDAPSLAGATITNDLPSGGYIVGVNYGVVLGNCVMKVITGANLTPGQAVMTDATGKAIAAVGTGVVLGYTIGASSSGDIVEIKLV